jgi:hypothetical protein
MADFEIGASAKYVKEPIAPWGPDPQGRLIEGSLKMGRDAILNHDGCAFKQLVHSPEISPWKEFFIPWAGHELKSLSDRINDPAIPRMQMTNIHHPDNARDDEVLVDFFDKDGKTIYESQFALWPKLSTKHTFVEKPGCEMS